MFRKNAILLIVVSLLLCVMCSCTVESEKTTATSTTPPASSAVIEDGNDLDITNAGFYPDKVKTGDTVSVFKVSSVNVEKGTDGKIVSGSIKFTGAFSVRGSYSLNDNVATFSPLSEYVKYLPYPVDAGEMPESSDIDAETIKRIYGDAENGYAAIVIEEYSLKYDTESGSWQVSVESFEKDENEYVYIQ